MCIFACVDNHMPLISELLTDRCHPKSLALWTIPTSTSSGPNKWSWIVTNTTASNMAYYLTPLHTDALGRLGPSAKSIISKLSNAIDDTKGARILFRQYWTKRIRAAVQIYHLKRLLANQKCRSPSYLAHKPKQDMKRFDDHLNGLPMRPFRNAKRRVAYVAAWLRGA